MKKVCVIGCGVVAPVHMKAVSALENAELYAVCDIVHERADKYAAEFSAKAYYDYAEVLADSEIDSVHICTPHYLHVPMATAALAVGKNVVLEKPVCMNCDELEALCAAEKASFAKLCIMLQNRTNNSIQELKRIIAEDKSIGRLMGISGVMNWHRDAEYYNSEAWRGRWDTEGGGAVINQAVHLLDLIDWFGGAKSIRASISTKLLGDVIEVEDTADAYMELENGANATFYATNTFAVNRPVQLEICFENAAFRYADSMLWRIEGENAEIVARDKGKKLGKDYWGSGHERVIKSFYDSLEDGVCRYITLDNARHSAALMCALYESAKSGEAVLVE